MKDKDTTDTQATNDNQDLASFLDGSQAATATATDTSVIPGGGLQFEETPLAPSTTSDEPIATDAPTADDAQQQSDLEATLNSQLPEVEAQEVSDDAPVVALDEPVAATADPAPVASDVAPTADPTPVADFPTADVSDTPIVAPPSDLTAPPAGSSPLDNLKKSALDELRPLVDHLDMPADEKFDTLLMIIRSTDDQSLLEAAHTAAAAIENDDKRAHALLDIIKEIDYFNQLANKTAA